MMNIKVALLSLIAISSRCGDIGVEVGIEAGAEAEAGAGSWGNGLRGWRDGGW